MEEFRIFFDDAYEWLVDDGLVVIPGYNKSSIIAKPFIRKTKTYRMSAYSKILNDAWVPSIIPFSGNDIAAPLFVINTQKSKK